MDPMGSVNNELVDLISSLNISTKFEHVMDQHLQNVQEYLTKEASGVKPLESVESYHAFCAANIAISKAKHMVWNDTSSEDISHADDDYKGAHMPPITSFHYTKDEKEMHKNRDFQSIKVGDVLHLKVIEEDKDKFKLHILNKYGDDKRIADSLLYADLIKDNPLVKQIVPPLQKSDLVRAVVFGNVKLEVGVYNSRLVSLNSKFVQDPKLKDLKLGRIFKKDIPFYPEDISEYRSFGEYLEKNKEFENPNQILQRTAALNVDPLKTGPIYDVRSPKHIHVPLGVKLPEFDYVSVIRKTKEAEQLLCDGQLKEALEKINESLSIFSEDSRALTVRGKILLAMSDICSSLNVKKAEALKKQAYKSFVDALKINCLNIEAANFHDSILRDAMLLNPAMEKEIQPHVQRPNHVEPSVEEFNIKFKSGNVQQVEKEVAKPSGRITVKRELQDTVKKELQDI